jgi:hypothetical protein
MFNYYNIIINHFINLILINFIIINFILNFNTIFIIFINILIIYKF